MTVAVAIVTARKMEETTYDTWRKVRNCILARKPYEDVVVEKDFLQGEFAALLATCLARPAMVHVEYQLRALAAGTVLPDEVIVVDRTFDTRRVDAFYYRDEDDEPLFPVIWTAPQVSRREMDNDPAAGMAGAPLKRNISLGCSDKNTALSLCNEDVLVMLDDCCLPGFGLVETVQRLTKENPRRVVLIGHRQLYLPVDGGQFEHADANWVAKETTFGVDAAQESRRVFGIWGMPMEHILAVNGFNTELDGSRFSLDEELMLRMDRYARFKELEYVAHPAARCYEIQQTHPWDTEAPNADDWKEAEGWRAPGPDLKTVAESSGVKELHRYINQLLAEDDEDEDAEDED